MQLFRITTAKWAGKLSGSGYPARWNSNGKYIIYTASNRALACLENLVHRTGEGLNKNFKLTVIDAPDYASIKKLQMSELPENWYKTSGASACRAIGDKWIESGPSLLLNVPSAIICDESNVLINPVHPEFKEISVRKVVDFEFDKRL